MQFTSLAAISLELDPQTGWLGYSHQRRAFVAADERKAFELPLSDPGKPAMLEPFWAGNAAAPSPACNLPVPAAVYDEMAEVLWHGFRFLDRDAYAHAADANGHPVGDLLRTLVFGPDYGQYLLHPPSGMIMALRSGAMELLERTPAGFKSIDRTRTRGRAALAFAAHPHEPLIAYGDNYGTFHAHRFDAGGFGKAGKIVSKERKASRLEFVHDGKILLIGGMGYLSVYSYESGKFAPSHETSIAVRDFVWLDERACAMINQGLHGVTGCRFDEKGFTKLSSLPPGQPVHQICVSACGRFMAASEQDARTVSLYAISWD